MWVYHANMKAALILHEKAVDELDNTIELKMWQLPEPTEERPHGYKYSLVYIVEGERMIGYDNAEGHGDHRHVMNKVMTYHFVNLRQLTNDFYNDIDKYKRGEL